MIANLESLIKDWLDYLVIHRNYSKNTYLSYKLDLEDFLQYTNNHIYDIDRIELLNKTHIRAWLANHASNGRSARANARGLSAIKNFFKYLLFSKIPISENLIEIRGPKFMNSLPRTVSEEEIKFSKIIELGNNPNLGEQIWIELRNKAIILLLYGAGLRITEALSVNFFNIDIDTLLLKVRGKGQKNRIVPLLPIVFDSLLAYIESCPFLHNDNCKNQEFLFFGRNGKPLSRNNFANQLKRLLADYGLPYNTSSHSFRHSFATHLLESGVDLKEIQTLLGHTNLSSTTIYTQVNNQLLREMYYTSHPDA